jgi:hypothetical protein
VLGNDIIAVNYVELPLQLSISLTNPLSICNSLTVIKPNSVLRRWVIRDKKNGESELEIALKTHMNYAFSDDL